MNNEKLIVTSDKATLNFAKEYYPRSYTSRRRYISLFHYLFHKGKGFPCFLSNDTAQHYKDIENIEIILKRRRIKKMELSVIVFDAHTDMYHYENSKKGEEIASIQGEVNMTNWILEMLRRGYDDLSILGVSDFTRSCPEREGQEYFRFNSKVGFFLGKEFDRTKDFKEDSSYKVKLMKLEDFLTNPLRKYAFISLDCDVSEGFAGHPMTRFTGYRGQTKLNEVIDILDYIKNKTNLIGFSLYGMYGCGFFSTFQEKKEVVKQVLDSI